LEECLAEGLSLEAIGKKVGKHESTVSYWLKKHGLVAAEAEKHAAKGDLEKSTLEEAACCRPFLA
jgi:transposase